MWRIHYLNGPFPEKHSESLFPHYLILDKINLNDAISYFID
ncbi:hypothetical protein RV12_GL001443 [Enterococcus quebecensis]|nr:hypothetical protein RV12_GL001443 [Enterococcus quebecensis]